MQFCIFLNNNRLGADWYWYNFLFFSLSRFTRKTDGSKEEVSYSIRTIVILDFMNLWNIILSNMGVVRIFLISDLFSDLLSGVLLGDITTHMSVLKNTLLHTRFSIQTDAW